MDNTQRDQQIAARYLGGIPVPKLALEHGLSVPSINRILETQKVDRTQRVRLRIPDKIIDHTHERVGQRLYNYRAFSVFEDRMTCATNLGWSVKKIAMIEQGHTVVSLAELKVIAAYMKQTLSQLLEDL